MRRLDGPGLGKAQGHWRGLSWKSKKPKPNMNHNVAIILLSLLAIIEYPYSRLAESFGLGMSFRICRGTLGNLAMFIAIRNASSRDNRFVDICRKGVRLLQPTLALEALLRHMHR